MTKNDLELTTHVIQVSKLLIELKREILAGNLELAEKSALQVARYAIKAKERINKIK